MRLGTILLSHELAEREKRVSGLTKELASVTTEIPGSFFISAPPVMSLAQRHRRRPLICSTRIFLALIQCHSVFISYISTSWQRSREAQDQNVASECVRSLSYSVGRREADRQGQVSDSYGKVKARDRNMAKS